VALGLLCAVAAGCVTRGTHDQVVAERDRLRLDKARLEAEAKRLAASGESLESERVRLLEEMEDLLQARQTLESDVLKLRRTEAILSEALREREAELGSRSEEFARLRGTFEALVADLEEEVAAGQIRIEQLRDGMRLNLTQDILFASGSARLNASGIAVLRKVASRVKAIPHRVEVQGHTDDVPIRGALAERYPSNWELAAARAIQVVRLLAEAGVAPSRLSAVSLGEFHPIASNQTPEGREKNRRIEIRLDPVPERAGPADPSSSP
jgi:chemotaxis protein MotB